MPLDAQRFQDNQTLRECVDSGYRMFAGERDREAVKRLQFALYDLGYPDITGIDRIWGPRTDDAVRAFKKDEQLHPTDAVASRGTIGELDMYFAWESRYPDHPDPSTIGLVEKAEETAETAASYADQTVAVLDSITWGGPSASPEEDPIRSALRAHVGLDAGSADADTDVQRARLMTLLAAMSTFLASSTANWRFKAMDRPEWDAAFGFSFYWAYRNLPDEGTRIITPPFRNALTATDRYAHLLRVAATNSDPALTIYAFPGTARYGSLSLQERRNNPVGVASLVLFVGAGISDGHRPPPTWGNLSSFPF